MKEYDLELEDLISQAIELEIITKDDDFSPFIFEDENLGKTKAAVAKFLKSNKDIFDRISELINEKDYDLDDDDLDDLEYDSSEDE